MTYGILYFILLLIIRQSVCVFDEELYESVLDQQLCENQLKVLNTATLLRLQLLDASFRLPRGYFQFNSADWGNYHQCHKINQPIDNNGIVEGKFCMIHVTLQQNGREKEQTPLNTILNGNTRPQPVLMEYRNLENVYLNYFRRSNLLSRSLDDVSLNLAICIPKVCTSRQAINNQFTELAAFDLVEQFCRLPNDKPFIAGDIAAIVILSIIGVLLILSTSYDLYCTFILRKDRNEIGKYSTAFSLYTNLGKLFDFKSRSDNIECIDGIRTISMIWLIIGHTFSTSISAIRNQSDTFNWINSYSSVWLIASPIAVDTFFVISGLLFLYTVTAKYDSRGNFLRNIHIHYISRYLRLFPLLAVVVMFQATLVNHLSDGPMWNSVGVQVENCRTFWWSTLLYVQNYVNPTKPCIGILWYLSVDMQLYWIFPIVLFFVIGQKSNIAWLALDSIFIISLAVGATLSFLANLPSTAISLGRPDELDDYMTKYYVNTLTRAAPFIIGTHYGYFLHLMRGKKQNISPPIVLLFWSLAILASSFVFFVSQPIGRIDYDNQILDNILNSFMRPMWAGAMGWLIVSCVHGYSGPLNWFLSLKIWKLPSRLSYAMFLFHYPLMFIYRGSLVEPLYFSVGNIVYRFLSDWVLTFIVSLIMTVAVEIPFHNIQKLVLKI